MSIRAARAQPRSRRPRSSSRPTPRHAPGSTSTRRTGARIRSSTTPGVALPTVSPITEEKRDPNPEFQQEQQLTKDVESSKVYQKYTEGKQTLAQVKAQFSQTDTTGDIAAMYTFMKSLDPGSTVGPADLANMKAAGGYMGQLASVWEEALGKGKTTPELRRQFYNTAVATLHSTAPEAKRLIETKQNVAKGYGLNPERLPQFEPVPDDISKPAKPDRRGREPFAPKEPRGTEEAPVKVDSMAEGFKLPDGSIFQFNGTNFRVKPEEGQ